MIFSPAWSFMFRAGALVPVLAVAAELSVCPSRKELARFFVPCSACRVGVVIWAPCSACAFCLQAHFK